jgi:hypothetical protein
LWGFTLCCCEAHRPHARGRAGRNHRHCAGVVPLQESRGSRGRAARLSHVPRKGAGQPPRARRCGRVLRFRDAVARGDHLRDGARAVLFRHALPVSKSSARAHFHHRILSRLRWPPPWFQNLLANDSERSASVFVIEAWIGKRWRPIARSDYEAAARRFFNQASYVCPAETILRLRRGLEILIKMPADGLETVRE